MPPTVSASPAQRTLLYSPVHSHLATPPPSQSDAPVDVLEAQLARRRATRNVARQRPPIGALKPGSEREGIVVRIEAYGAVVNVGARSTGRLPAAA